MLYNHCKPFSVSKNIQVFMISGQEVNILTTILSQPGLTKWITILINKSLDSIFSCNYYIINVLIIFLVL